MKIPDHFLAARQSVHGLFLEATHDTRLWFSRLRRRSSWGLTWQALRSRCREARSITGNRSTDALEREARAILTTTESIDRYISNLLRAIEQARTAGCGIPSW